MYQTKPTKILSYKKKKFAFNSKTVEIFQNLYNVQTVRTPILYENRKKRNFVPVLKTRNYFSASRPINKCNCSKKTDRPRRTFPLSRYIFSYRVLRNIADGLRSPLSVDHRSRRSFRPTPDELPTAHSAAQPKLTGRDTWESKCSAKSTLARFLYCYRTRRGATHIVITLCGCPLARRGTAASERRAVEMRAKTAQREIRRIVRTEIEFFQFVSHTARSASTTQTLDFRRTLR